MHEFFPNPQCAKHHPKTPHCLVCGFSYQSHPVTKIELTYDESKFLAMLLLEDRSKVLNQIKSSLGSHGKGVLEGLQNKLAVEVLGVEF